MNIRLNSLKLLAFIQLILITVMLYVGSLQAQSPEPQSFTYYRAFPVQADCNTTHRGLAGNIKTLFIKYDALHQTFLIDSLVERCSATGHLANSFAGAFNGGPNPKGHPGELAKIQADFRNPSHPIITVYGYNGVANSWLDGFRDTDVNGIPGMPGLQTPDRIASSLIDNSFVLKAERIDYPNGNERRFILEISVAQINAHSPLWPVPGVDWTGIQFGSQIGTWFHPYLLNDTTTYCSLGDASAPCNMTANGVSPVGYLKWWGYTEISWYDTSYLTANPSPTCLVSVEGPTFNQEQKCYDLALGQTLKSQISFTDGKGDDFEVTYQTTLPSDATITPQSGTTFSGAGTVALEWTPSIANQGDTHSIQFMSTDTGLAMAECGFDICVESNLPPSCNIQFTSQAPAICGGVVTEIGVTGAGSHDPENGALTYSWTTDCTESSIDVIGNGTSTAQMSKLLLELPGKGLEVSGCLITLTVSDGVNAAQSCSLPIAVSPCTLDCNDVPNGSAVVDECGVCGGDNSSCKDCKGVPNGPAVETPCGCDAGLECLDCAGVPNGTAQVDQCDVCNGNGLSCVTCDNLDIFGFQAAADGRAKDLESTIRQLIVARTVRFLQIANGGVNKNITEWAREAKETAQTIQNEAWEAIWAPESIVSTCSENALNVCVSVSNASHIDVYKVKLSELLVLGENLTRRLRRASYRAFQARGRTREVALRKSKAIAKQATDTMQQFFSEGILAASAIPETSTKCGQL